MPPGQFNSIYVYAFGKPPPEIVEGRVITNFSGNYSKFVGFTELNFPLFTVADDTVPLATVPPPVQLAYADIGNTAKMLGASAPASSPTPARSAIPPPNPTNDATSRDHRQLAASTTSSSSTTTAPATRFTNIAVELPAKVLGTFDPLKVVGKTATITGMLRNNSGQNPYLDGNGNTISCSTLGAVCQGDLHHRHLLQERLQLLDDRSAPPGRHRRRACSITGKPIHSATGDNMRRILYRDVYARLAARRRRGARG